MNESLEDPVDAKDYKKLLVAILRQALDDYCKLQHPKFRRKKHLQKAFDSAVDMLFDDEYQLLHIKNEDGNDANLKEFLSSIVNVDTHAIQHVREYVINQTVAFWETKDIRTIEIPSTLQVSGHVYRLIHSDDTGYAVDYAAKEIHMSTADTSDNEEQFVLASVEITCHHEDITMSKKHREKLAKAWFRTLRINNCFCGTL